MLYVLDSGVLITANNLYYPVDRVPEFWAWLLHMGARVARKFLWSSTKKSKKGERMETKILSTVGFAMRTRRKNYYSKKRST